MVTSPQGQVSPSVPAANRYHAPPAHGNTRQGGTAVRDTTGWSKQKKTASTKKKQRVTVKQILHLAHRTGILVHSLVYIFICFSATNSAMKLLRGHDNPTVSLEALKFDLMLKYAGLHSIRESPLVVEAFQNSTTPVQGTMYLDASDTSFTACSSIPDNQMRIYSNEFLRSVYASITTDTDYHFTEMADWELIAPIVDCTSGDVQGSDSTSAKLFYLVRMTIDPQDDVFLFVVTLSIQEYTIVAQKEHGPAGVATIQQVRDMRATDVTTRFILALGYPFEQLSFRVYDYVNTTTNGQWTLRSIPETDLELTKIILTSCHSGFYIKGETEQSNVNSLLWVLYRDAVSIIGCWRWTSTPVLHDSWAWVHGVQFFIGISLLVNIAILSLTTYRQFRTGKLWIGDAFVSLTSSQLVNGMAVLISWYVNEFWSLAEYIIHIANDVAEIEQVLVYTPHSQADFMTLYFSACGIIGTLLRERIDPLFALIVFDVFYQSNSAIVGGIASVRESVTDYARAFLLEAIVPPLEGQETISPMQYWTSHPVGKLDPGFVAVCLLPLAFSLIFVVLYVCAKKMHRHYFPEKLHIQYSTTPTGRSENQEALVAQKRVLTLFEIATGAELENRFGLVAEYERCIFIKGMKFASADGIYSTGFVIANKRFLVQTRDIWSIVIMKIVRTRYKNIYVYEVDGSTVQQTARLVYPQTLTITDLWYLNVSILS